MAYPEETQTEEMAYTMKKSSLKKWLNLKKPRI